MLGMIFAQQKNQWMFLQSFSIKGVDADNSEKLNRWVDFFFFLPLSPPFTIFFCLSVFSLLYGGGCYYATSGSKQSRDEN